MCLTSRIRQRKTYRLEGNALSGWNAEELEKTKE